MNIQFISNFLPLSLEALPPDGSVASNAVPLTDITLTGSFDFIVWMALPLAIKGYATSVT